MVEINTVSSIPEEFKEADPRLSHLQPIPEFRSPAD